MRKAEITKDRIEENKRRPAAHLTKYEDVLIRIFIMVLKQDVTHLGSEEEIDKTILQATDKVFELIQRSERS